MKEEILNKLNHLKVNEISLSIPTKKQDEWRLFLYNENLQIKFVNILGQEGFVKITLEKSNKELSFVYSEQELENFLETIKQSVSDKYFFSAMEKEKRNELLKLLHESPSVHPDIKESVTLYSENEEKKYYLRKVSFNVENSFEDLSKIKFHHFKITELTKDRRLKNSSYESKEYNILLSNKEYREIFDIDLKEEKEKIYKEYFENIFNKKLENEIEEKKSSENQNKEEITKKETTTNKIKKIL